MCKFRSATDKDFEGICKLIKSKEDLYLVYPGGTYPFTVAQVRELSRTRKELTVTVDGDAIVGFANLYHFKPNESAFIGNVVIDQNYRSKGLGKSIVAHMLNIAFEKHNLTEVRISVFSENITALLLYSGIGFLPYDIEERKGPQGNRVALIHMKMTRGEGI